MATEMNLSTPVKLKIVNKTDFVRSFQPYRENFISALKGHATLEFEVNDSEAALYYLKQGTEELEITEIESFDSPSLTVTVVPNAAVMTLTNIADVESKVIKSFVPYKQNFQEDLKAGDSVELDANSLAEFLYYMGQETDGLTVTYAAKN